MMPQPPYFKRIQDRATRRWDQLDGDPDLSGPWLQLFKQVQSPRHVLSEMLQNADDAGATETLVVVDKQQFIFTHDGGDFIEEHFESLCRFGYSNKRALHTIGFRGVGFKSLFSLGNRVELFTPTLSVEFGKARFTQPKWVAHPPADIATTQIQVSISDEHRGQELIKNLRDWLSSPLSLLFFKNIRRMKIGDEEVYWESLGPGPVEDSEWMALNGNVDEAKLLIRSEAEEFPPDALEEIRQERLLSADQDADFPPCKVEAVLGAKGQLYVVLPTGVETGLPFACNAPFIQDPARLKIKDPETSPTNRWLLERVGRLAACVMLQWLGQREVSITERSRAYGLLPDFDQNDNSLEGLCARSIGDSFNKAISGLPFLLTENGDLTPANESICLPEALLEVWPSEQASAILDNRDRPALSRFVSAEHRTTLIRSGYIGQIGKADVLNILQSSHLPKPETWRHLLKLWAYIAPDMVSYRTLIDKTRLRIIPVQGKDVLYASVEVVRLGEKKLLQSDQDWEFLDHYLIVLNQKWPRFLAEERRSAEDRHDNEAKRDVEAAYSVFDAIGLAETTDVSDVVEQVAWKFFTPGNLQIADCVRLAQIAAKLGAKVGASFRFVTQDRHLRGVDKAVLFDKDGTLEQLLPETWRSEHLLYPDYGRSYTSCNPDEWNRWIATGRAGVLAFVPLSRKQSYIWSESALEAELRLRGCRSTPSYSFLTMIFLVEDWDFEETHWRHWSNLATDDEKLWGRVVEQLLGDTEGSWTTAGSASFLQEGTFGRKRANHKVPILPAECIPAKWVIRLREFPCLPDKHGIYRKPAELLLRTAETEPFMDVEPFVHGRLDTEKTRPLLQLLGVRNTPFSSEGLLGRLRALAKADRPPIHEVEKWYQRLDLIMDTCSTADSISIKNAFKAEKLIFTQGGIWTNSLGVFLSSDEDVVPDADTIRGSLQHLTLWRKLGIAERPSVEMALQWLNQLPQERVLVQSDANRVRALLARHPNRIWEECGHWLNLANEWVPTASLEYALTMQPLIRWGHLHQAVKQKTADLQYLPTQISETMPFSGLPRLAILIEERFDRNPRVTVPATWRAWLNQIGKDLERIELPDEAETARVRAKASELATTQWQTAQDLHLIPYIEGTPAGTPRSAEAIWFERVLYVENRSMAKLALAVSREIGRAFRPDIEDAIKYCFNRSPEDVTEYLEEVFRLTAKDLPTEAVPNAAGSEAAATEEVVDQHRLQQSASEFPEGEDAQPKSLTLSPPRQPEDNADQEFGENERIETEPPDDEVKPHRTHQVAKPPKPSIMERLALQNGYRKDSNDRFFHPDGSWISKPPGNRFWERHTASGHVSQYYWPRDHCLEREPLEIEADIWDMITSSPEIYAVVLSDVDEKPVEIVGTRLLTMRDLGEIQLFPASWRLKKVPVQLV
jgi:hypothetical protein